MVIILQHYPNLYLSLCEQIKTQGEQKVKRLSAGKSVEAGFSLIELLIAVLILMIMTAVSLLPFIAHHDAYRTENQALQLINFLEDAKMRALAKHHTIRFEIDLTANVLRTIDENENSVMVGTSDDFIVKEEKLVEGVRFNPQPANLTGIFPNVSFNATPLYYSSAIYAPSTHPLSTRNGTGSTVWTARFWSDGTVTTPYGCSSADCPSNVTIFIWRADQNNSTNADPVQAVRAVTISAGTGNVRMWQYNGTSFNEW